MEEGSKRAFKDHYPTSSPADEWSTKTDASHPWGAPILGNFQKYFKNIAKKIKNLASFMLFLTYFQIFQLFFGAVLDESGTLNESWADVKIFLQV